MADNDDFGDNKDEDMKLDAELLKILEDYAGCDADSSKINERRAKLRAKADKLGISSHALQDGVYKLKKQTKSERLADEKATRRLVRAAEGRQAELWPEAVAATEKRAERKKERAAKEAAAAGKETPEQQQRRLDADTNPRSDPKRGGAGKKPKKSVEDLNRAPLASDTVAVAAQASAPLSATQNALEQAEGEAILDQLSKGAGLTGKTGLGSVADEKPLSQSAQAAKVREDLGLDK